MKRNKPQSESLAEKLEKISSQGIQADRQHLKRNMCTQFSDYYEFIREYVVNAYDASATFCMIKVSEEDSSLKIGIQDNGNGMNLERLKDFLTVFRSRKDNHMIKSIGRHGIGKLSVAALPGLINFKAVTSTSTECYEFETDNLLDDHPIEINKNSMIPPQGTLFEITVRKETTAPRMAQKLYDILYTYVRFLPITIRFVVNNESWPANNSGRAFNSDEWAYSSECYGRSFTAKLGGKYCEIVLGIGTGVHEIYQNRVFITSMYNLFSYGCKNDIRIPNLMIRADSEAFELPFGRHCLCNEEILNQLSYLIREKILPSYFDYLTGHFDFVSCAGIPRILEKTDEMTIGLLNFKHLRIPWSSYPVFRTVEGNRLTMTELDEKIKTGNCLYVEAEKNEGIDFSHFNGPVLSCEQASGTVDLLESLYKEFIINLNDEDTVIEMPQDNNKKLSNEQKRFESFLAFRPCAIDFSKFTGRDAEKGAGHFPGGRSPNISLKDLDGLCEEARTAQDDLFDLIWRVNYLVERDGTTPCLRKKFMLRNNTITLNLYHAEIKEFVQMSTLSPALAAHWAIAMCLADKKVLPHISEEAREDLLIIDAISRLANDKLPDHVKDKSGDFDRKFMDFVRNCINKAPNSF